MLAAKSVSDDDESCVFYLLKTIAFPGEMSSNVCLFDGVKKRSLNLKLKVRTSMRFSVKVTRPEGTIKEGENNVHASKTKTFNLRRRMEKEWKNQDSSYL